MKTAERSKLVTNSLLSVIALLAGLTLGASATGDRMQVLFNKKDFTGWRQPTGEWMAASAVSLDPADPTKFVVEPGEGIMVNGPKFKTVNITTETELGDAEIHIEFCISKNSNSGIYIMGRYELQVYDSFGVDKAQYPGIECGGIYPRWINEKNVEGHSPRVNVSRPPGKWQSFDIIFRAPRFDANGKKVENAKLVEVLHNGKVIHENLELSGPTRGGTPEQEGPTGPLCFQGDHGPVAYRNLKVRPLKLK